ncbi:MAG: hypothetical protein ABMA02_13660 [Saprospiraceae bacterium]
MHFYGKEHESFAGTTFLHEEGGLLLFLAAPPCNDWHLAYFAYFYGRIHTNRSSKLLPMKKHTRTDAALLTGGGATRILSQNHRNSSRHARA